MGNSFKPFVDKINNCDTLISLSMEKRFFLLTALVLLVGFVTRAFAAELPSNEPISRAGAVALVVEADPLLKERLQHYIKNPPPMPLFDDMDYSQWYAPYIETAFEAGIVTGNANRRFRPGDVLAEEEAIVLMARTNARKRPDTIADLNTTGGDWFSGALNAAVKGGVQLPSPIRLGMPISKNGFFSMMSSTGVQNPQQIALSHQPKPAPVIIRPVVAQATTPRAPATNRPVQPRPVVQQPAARPTYVAQAAPTPARTTTTTTAPQASAKSFAISLPSLGIKDLTITHPSNPTTSEGLLAPLKYGVGHLFSYPGKGGTILVYGHSSSYGWDVSNYTKIFRQINKLSVGDKIYVTYGGKVHTYQVTHKRAVDDKDFSAYQGGRGEELILYTCWPPDSIDQRYLVHAAPVSEVAAR